MQVSKAALAALALLLAAAGCSSKDSKPAGASDATFVVDQLTKVSVTDSKADGVYTSLATAKQYDFTACIRDVAVLEPVQGEKFRVTGESGEIAVRTTDQSGCITWSESVPVNSLADETYALVERSIEAITAHKGVQRIPLALNPLAKGGDAAIDRRYRTPPKSVVGQAQRSSLTESALLIEQASAEIQINQTTSSGAAGVIRLKLQPKIRRLGLDGKKMHETLVQGRFRINLQLLANNNLKLVPISGRTENTVDFSDGQVFFETAVQLNEIPNERTVELLVDVEPVDSPVPLGRQTSLLTVGRISQVLTKAGGDLRPLSLSVAKLDPSAEVRAAAAGSEDGAAPPPAKPASGSTRNMEFNLGEVKVLKVSPMNISPTTGRPNRVLVEVGAKVTNGISQEPIINQRFELDEVGSSRIPVDSNEEGLVKWHHTIDFSSISNESYFRRKVKLKIQDEFYNFAEVEREVAINPWQYDNPSLLLVDTKFNQVPNLSVQGQNLPEILVDNMEFSFRGRSFEIDNQLNFAVLRRYDFVLHPKVKRVTASGLKEEELGNGRYQVRFLLQLQGHLEMSLEESYLHAVTVDAVAQGNTLRASVVFPFTSLPDAANRNLISVEIIPTGGHTKFKPATFSGDFVTVDMKGSIDLSANPAMAHLPDVSRIAAKRAADKNRIIDVLTIFQKRYRVLPVSAADLAARKINETERNGLVAQPKQSGSTLAKFCSYYFPAGEVLKNCQKSPLVYLDFINTEHVRRVNTKQPVKPIASDIFNITVSADFSFRESDSEDRNSGASTRKEVDNSTRAGVSLPIANLGTGVSFSVGRSWYESDTRSVGKSTGAGTMLSSGKTVNADELVFKLNVSLIRCLVISPKLKPTAPNPASLAPGLHVCDPQLVTKDITEKYYYIYLFFRALTSPVVDATSDAKERPWTILIRGESRFKGFSRAMENTSNTIRLQRSVTTPGAVLGTAENKFDGFFPGLVTID